VNNKPIIYPSKAVNTAFLMLTIFSIVSCSSLPEVTTAQPDRWDDEIQLKKKIKHWGIKGRLGIQTESDGGTFDLFWNQDDDHYTIRLIAPLGQGALTIEGDSKVVSYRDGQGMIQHTDNPDLLIRESLGVDLPIVSLREWLRGMPDEQLRVESISWNEQDQLHRLQQLGWTIEMLRYQLAGKVSLPHFFVLQREDRPELVIRLSIRQWSFDD